LTFDEKCQFIGSIASPHVVVGEPVPTWPRPCS